MKPLFLNTIFNDEIESFRRGALTVLILNSIKYLFSFDAYKSQDKDVSVPKLGTFAFQAQCFQIKELSDARKTL